jgi:hypothetical protein
LTDAVSRQFKDFLNSQIGFIFVFDPSTEKIENCFFKIAFESQISNPNTKYQTTNSFIIVQKRK